MLQENAFEKATERKAGGFILCKLALKASKGNASDFSEISVSWLLIFTNKGLQELLWLFHQWLCEVQV